MITEQDRYFFDIAKSYAQKSKCVKRQVGALLVERQESYMSPRKMGGGHNRPIFPKEPTAETCLRKDCAPGEKPDVVCCLHAEIDALLVGDAAGSTLYVTLFPCSGCARAIIGAGVERVVYGADYVDAGTVLEMFAAHDVVVDCIHGG